MVDKKYTFEGNQKYLPYVGGNVVLCKEQTIDFQDGQGPQHFDDCIKYTAQNGKTYKISPAACRAISEFVQHNKHMQSHMAIIEAQESK